MTDSCDDAGIDRKFQCVIACNGTFAHWRYTRVSRECVCSWGVYCSDDNNKDDATTILFIVAALVCMIVFVCVYVHRKTNDNEVAPPYAVVDPLPPPPPLTPAESPPEYTEC